VSPDVPEAWGHPRTRTVTWHDPNIAGALASELTGREFLQRIVDGQLPPPPIAALLGAWLVSVGDGEAVFRCAPDESTYNPIGMVHGGFLCTLLDSAAGCAVHSLLPAGTGYASIEIKVSFLKALRTHSGETRDPRPVLRVGQRVAFAEAHAATGENHLVGHATTSLAVVRA
jgi:uncharacterized protein (TIGR00369 family)